MGPGHKWPIIQAQVHKGGYVSSMVICHEKTMALTLHFELRKKINVADLDLTHIPESTSANPQLKIAAQLSPASVSQTTGNLKTHDHENKCLLF